MKLEIYTEDEVSIIDKTRCILGFNHKEFGTYTTIGPFYVVYKNIQIAEILEICNILS